MNIVLFTINIYSYTNTLSSENKWLGYLSYVFDAICFHSSICYRFILGLFVCSMTKHIFQRKRNAISLLSTFHDKFSSNSLPSSKSVIPICFSSSISSGPTEAVLAVFFLNLLQQQQHKFLILAKARASLSSSASVSPPFRDSLPKALSNKARKRFRTCHKEKQHTWIRYWVFPVFVSYVIVLKLMVYCMLMKTYNEVSKHECG